MLEVFMSKLLVCGYFYTLIITIHTERFYTYNSVDECKVKTL